MRIRIAAAVLGVAVLGTPAVAQSKDEDKKGQAGYEEAISHAIKHGDYQPHQERYLRAYDDYADQLGVQAAGRNIVLFGLLTEKGVKDAPKGEVVKDAEMFEAALAAPAEITVPTETTTATTTTSYSGVTSSSTVMCESGGDYSANTGNGYYGGYQFDSG